MIEFSKHIESLLLDNDCVIVPDFGGFIAHYQPAYYEEAEELFIPPTRTVGFNPQLTMNDGLLVQSYMQAYHTDYSDALNSIEKKVNVLKESLYKGETVEFHGIGSLRYNIYDEYEFHSNESGLLSPSLYGLDAFSMSPLSQELPVEEKDDSDIMEYKREFRLNPVRWIGNVAAVAIAIVMFFILSVPVENTYIEKGSYASLGTDCLFDAIRSQSIAASLDGVSVEKEQANLTKDIKPKAVRVEKVSPVEKKEVHEKTSDHVAVKTKPVEKETVHSVPVAKKAEKVTPSVKKKVEKKVRYHIIVSSLATSSDAQRVLKEFNEQGYRDASILTGNGRFRISLCGFSDKAEAYQKLNALKSEDAFKNAWMLTSK